MTTFQRIAPRPDLQPVDGFDALTRVTLLGLESKASQRVYRQTFNAWGAWCLENGSPPLDLRPTNVVDFLASGDTTKATRQRQLSALRKLAQMLYILDPTDDSRRYVEALRLTKAPTSESSGHERSRKALTPSEADKMLRVWNGSRPADARNRALVALLLLGGIRRSEAAGLRWRDVDFENGVLYVRHGKGDKSRDVPLAGEYALDALRAWRRLQPQGYEWVFCAVNKGGNCGEDRPVTGTDVYRIWVKTSEQAGIECKPHDARRTFITEALATGTPLATVQSAAGHANGETTLRYAQAVDARKARKELRLRYG
jgi:integrase/recombinase XerD